MSFRMDIASDRAITLHDLQGLVGSKPFDIMWQVSGRKMRIDCRNNLEFWLELDLPLGLPIDFYQNYPPLKDHPHYMDIINNMRIMPPIERSWSPF